MEKDRETEESQTERRKREREMIMSKAAVKSDLLAHQDLSGGTSDGGKQVEGSEGGILKGNERLIGMTAKKNSRKLG